MAGEDDEKALTLERKNLVPPETPPIPVFHFALTRVGNQILLEPGFVDLVEVRTALEQVGEELPSAPRRIPLYIKERYLLDRRTLVLLRDAAEEILQGMADSAEGEKP